MQQNITVCNMLLLVRFNFLKSNLTVFEIEHVPIPNDKSYFLGMTNQRPGFGICLHSADN